MFRKACFYFAKLNTEAAQFDLLVFSSQELDVAVGSVTSEVPGIVESLGCAWMEDEAVVCLLQIAGGGRLLLGCGGRKWWSRRPPNAAWEAFPSAVGQTYETKEEAESVIANLIR